MTSSDGAGLVGPPATATGYTLASGILFATPVAVLFAPVVHRFLHHLQLELDDERS